MGRLFGTDGVRGVANIELSCELAFDIGRAAVISLNETGIERPRIIIGKDTRISSDMLEGALTAGICSMGADLQLVGIIPTPAVAFLVKKYGADAGIMISASHNPAEYNGIKIFNNQGYKLPDEIEMRIEQIIENGFHGFKKLNGDKVGKTEQTGSAVIDYINHIKESVDCDLSGIKVVIDAANGSASATAAKLFSLMGADCIIYNDNPDGTNINRNCGSTHIELLPELVRKHKCDIGISFDGDADRCLAVDENGEPIDGDKLIAIFASFLKKQGRLKDNTAVVTVMSNIGFFKFAEENGIEVVTTKVGDRYVLEEMLRGGYCIGGEQSGHIIFTDYASTGDGQLSAAMLLAILKQTGKKASELAKIMDCYPQVMENVRVSNEGKQRLEGDSIIQQRIKAVQQRLGKEGRILVRSSGTEPLIRVMLEGKDIGSITAMAKDVAGLISERLA